ncbi:unnamed protein product, partial [Cyprideis torosa]
VLRTRVGYAGGSKYNPTYYRLGDHTETVEVSYDPNEISYVQLLDIFWKNHDYVTARRRQYMSVIFVQDQEQWKLAKESSSGKGNITTLILPLEVFWDAEGYHQKYYLQGHPWLLSTLNIPSDQLMNSTLAARLNAAVSGYSTREQILKLPVSDETERFLPPSEWDDFGAPMPCSELSAAFSEHGLAIVEDLLMLKLAEESKLQRKNNVTTQILPFEKFWNAEFYHQKYILQRHAWILTTLNMEPEELYTSTLAARLNGALCGCITPSEVDTLISPFELSEKVKQYVLRNVPSYNIAC